MVTWRAWCKDILMIIQSIDEAISRYGSKYSQAWAICNYSWSLAFSSSRLLICRFMSQSSRWCFRFASYNLFRAARDSSSRLAIRAFCYSKVFRLSIVLYKAWDFKKDRLATSYKIPKCDWSDITNYSTQASSRKRRFTLVYLKHHCMESASFFILSTDSNGSSKSSFPNSSCVDCGKDWKGTNLTAGVFDPSAPLLPVLAAFEVPLVLWKAYAWVLQGLAHSMSQACLYSPDWQLDSQSTRLPENRVMIK